MSHFILTKATDGPPPVLNYATIFQEAGISNYSSYFEIYNTRLHTVQDFYAHSNYIEFYI